MGSEDTTEKLPRALVDWEKRLDKAEKRIESLEQRFNQRGYDTRPMYEVHEEAIKGLTQRLDQLESHSTSNPATVAAKTDLDELEVTILKLLADPTVPHYPSGMTLQVNENIVRVEYYFQRLMDGRYAERVGRSSSLKITQKGREYLIKHDLL